MRLCELREKEVINSCDCKRLGCVVDLEVNLCTGNVEAIIIPVECIKKIGKDIILVEIKEEKFLKNCKY